jgi:hypothetical protein
LNALTCATGYAVGRAAAASGDFYGCFLATGVTTFVRASASAAPTDVVCATGYYKSAAVKIEIF